MNGQERPTASCIRVDVSPGEPRASAAPASRHWVYREDPRWVDGHRIESCACGGELLQYLGESIPDVVVLHNLTGEHQAWSDWFRGQYQ